MPIYEYRCQSCGHQLEAMQKMSDDPLVECPECHKPELRKLMSAGGGHVFKEKTSGSPCGAAAGACGTGGCPARH